MTHPHLVTRAYVITASVVAEPSVKQRLLAASDTTERDAVVAFLRRQADLMNLDDRAEAVDLLRAAAACIEAGDHLR